MLFSRLISIHAPFIISNKYEILLLMKLQITSLIWPLRTDGTMERKRQPKRKILRLAHTPVSSVRFPEIKYLRCEIVMMNGIEGKRTTLR